MGSVLMIAFAILVFQIADSLSKGFNVDNLIVGVLAFCIMVLVLQDMDTPEAIDVYRGNTALEITYKDSVPVDTVVVFKDK